MRQYFGANFPCDTKLESREALVRTTVNLFPEKSLTATKTVVGAKLTSLEGSKVIFLTSFFNSSMSVMRTSLFLSSSL